MGSFCKTDNKFITIDLARERLGKRGENMTDKQIEDLLNLLRFISNKTIDFVIQPNI